MEDILGIMNKRIIIQTIKPIKSIPVGYIDTFTVNEKNYEGIAKAFFVRRNYNHKAN